MAAEQRPATSRTKPISRADSPPLGQAAVSVNLKESDITINFQELPYTSQEVLSAAKRFGIKFSMNASEFDALRARGAELRKLLSSDPSKIDLFVCDPKGWLASLNQTPPTRGRPRRRLTAVNWKGLNTNGEIAAESRILARWVISEPGRLELFRRSPITAIELALGEKNEKNHKQLIKMIKRVILNKSKAGDKTNRPSPGAHKGGRL